MINFNKQNLPFFKPKKGALFSKSLLLSIILMMGWNLIWGQATLPLSRTAWWNASAPTGWTDAPGGTYLTTFACTGNDGGKFAATGDRYTVYFNSAPNTVTFTTKASATPTSCSLLLQESANGTSYTTVSGTISLSTTCTVYGPFNLLSASRYVRWTYTKAGSVNLTFDDVSITSASPSAPTITLITSGNSQLSVAFTAGAAGASAITNYKYSTDGGSTFTAVSPAQTTSPIVITGLTNGTSYNVQIKAVNAIGDGTATSSTAATPATTPSAPTITGITPTNGQLSVAYTAGTTGGSAITNYQYSTNGGTNWQTRASGTTASPLVINTLSTNGSTTLTNGVSYDVQIRAVNAIGNGTATATTAATPATTPGAPTGITITPGSGQLSVAFTAPSSDGGSAITNYKYSIDGGTNFTAVSPAQTSSPILITSLSNGTSYNVQIKAVNAIGDGTATASTSATPATTPSAPTITSITPGDQELSVAFTAGATGGAAISNYKYSTDGGTSFTAVSPATTTSPITITSLINGTTYDVQIKAVNAQGDGIATATTQGTPSAAPVAPGAPTITSITPSNGQLSVAFTAGATGGSVILNYQYSTDAGTNWQTRASGTTASPLIINTLSTNGTTTLSNGVSYDVQIRAVNAIGNGTASPTTAATPATTPDAPTITGITPSNGQLSVAFTAPSFNGGSTITNYKYSTDGGTTFITRTTGTTASPLVITTLSTNGSTTLTNGTSYNIQILAVNSFGDGTATATTTATPATTPSAPTGIAITPGNTQLSVAFTAGATGGSAITNYKYSTDGGSNFTTVSPSQTISPIVITGLTNGTSYNVQIKAVNSIGDGTATATTAATPVTTPSAPTITSITSGNQQLSVAFTAGATGGSAVTNYQYSTDGGATFRTRQTGTTATPLVITTLSSDGTTALSNGTSYNVQIKAVNNVGDGTATANTAGTPELVYCTPSGSSANTTYINTFTTTNGLSNISNSTTGYSTSGYGVFTGQSVTQYAGNSLGFSVVLVGGTAGIGIWVDWNSDGDFSDANEAVYNSNNYKPTGTTSSTFNVPSGQAAGSYRMRAIVDYSATSPTSCVASSGSRGEAEDYTFTVLSSVAPLEPTITSITSGSNQLSVNFTAGNTGGSAITNYKYSTDGGASFTACSPVQTTSPIIITGLTNGTSYNVQIKAVNNIGDGTATSSTIGTPAIVNTTASLYNGTSSAWLTVGNWPNGLPSSTVVAQFGTAINTTVGVNMNGASVAQRTVAGIELVSGANARTVNNSSSSAANNLIMTGAIINGVSNTIIRNNSSNLLTIADGSSQLLGIALGNATDNIINIEGTGAVSVTCIVSGVNPLTKTGSGTGVLTLTSANTYTGLTKVTAGTLRLNRSGGTTIPVTNNITVDGGTLQVSTNQTLNNLTLTSGTLIIDAGVTLTINGTITRTSGLIQGTATSNLVITGASGTIAFDQTTPGTTNVLKNLTISGSGTTTLGNALNITGGSTFGVVTVGTGATLATGGNLTLKSDASGTACIGNSAGIVSGNVTVERYISGAGRYWRFLSSPVQSATIASWMSQFYVTGPCTLAPTGGLGSINDQGWHTSLANIDYPGAYNVSTNNRAVRTTSIRQYVEANATSSTASGLNAGWADVTTATTLTPGKGFRAFIRGPIGTTGQLNGTVLGQAAVTLSLNGTVNQGAVSAPTLTYSGSGLGWNLIGNPYPCAYDWTSNSTVKTNIVNTVHVFDATSNSYKSYNTSSGGSLTSGYIPSGAAFFVQATGSGAAVTFNEAAKVTGVAPTVVHKGAKTNEFTIKYSKDSTENDEFIAMVIDNATLNKDGYDIIKLGNENLNLSSYGEDTMQLTLSAIPQVVSETRIKLNVEATAIGTYNFDFKNMDNFQSNITVSLFDRYTNKTNDVRKNTKYTFDMGAGVNQWGKNRFELILNLDKTNVDEFALLNQTHMLVYPNPATDVLNISINNATFKNSDIVVYNISGTEVLKTNMAATSAQLNIETLSNGVYFVKVSNQNGFNKTVKFVK
jgi:predicted RNA-binding protein with TRAM domain